MAISQLPAGISEATALRVPGHGMSKATAGGPPGGLNIRVQVEIPEYPTAEERAMHEQLRALAKKKPHGKKHLRGST